jgi:hypothetical protein
MGTDEGAKRFILEQQRVAEERAARRSMRIAMANEGDWLSELEVNGIGRPAPVVIAAIETAYQQVRQFARQLKDVPLKYFVEGSDVRVNFARLTAAFIAKARIDNPTRWYSPKLIDTNGANIALARRWFQNYVVWLGPRRGLVNTTGIDTFSVGGGDLGPRFRGTFGPNFEPMPRHPRYHAPQC